jgi:hypothetical protein
MDPITTAIAAALLAGVTGGVTDAGKKAITDAYNALKALLKKKFGDESEVLTSVKKLEANPNSQNRQGTLNEDLVAVHADQDAEILQAAQTLLNQVKSQPGGNQYILTVIGNFNPIVQGGGTATVNFHPPEQP